jgi:hypothetical protein
MVPAGSRPLPQHSATIVQHQGSLVSVGSTEGAGGRGRSCPREHDGPEQGRSGLGFPDAGSAGSVKESRSNSRSKADFPVDRLEFEMTSRPQLARAVEGATPKPTRSTNAPATQCVTRPRDEEAIGF